MYDNLSVQFLQPMNGGGMVLRLSEGRKCYMLRGAMRDGGQSGTDGDK